ncbi:PadR family transcriptional regulator [Streptomyces turgidiscabies]|uniref:PadR family transcriptional regulator n=1 Tax=Streptomyces TaxID=1883 RepID=UPI00073E5683|nr:MULTISPECIES: PadR family transcriptional regulator [Streptomyces]MDX3497257.1 PadR family transcriptional regulator [Streptomyces turgidiscabies]GAQ68648.1 transcriptional regulator PadR-like family protein [Streptomyces turgidiscabies]
MTNIRLTKPTMAVLGVLLNVKPDAPAWGLSICRDADLGPGTVYPILDRLLERGWLRSWNEEEAHPGRPARRFYEFTNVGRAQALEALEVRNARRARFGLRPTGGVA